MSAGQGSLFFVFSIICRNFGTKLEVAICDFHRCYFLGIINWANIIKKSEKEKKG
jgi:hypothetical protein